MKKSFKKGFTLIELLVATSLFVIVTTALITSLSIFLVYNISLQNEQQVLHSLGFATDTITREARLGVSFGCFEDVGGKCVGLNVTVPVFSSEGGIGKQQLCYRYNTLRSSLERAALDPGSGIGCADAEPSSYIPLTNPNINITEATRFEIEGISTTDNSQPNVDLYITAKYNIDYVGGSSEQTVSTVIGVTQRILDLQDTDGYLLNDISTSFLSYIYNDDGDCTDENGSVVFESGSNGLNPCESEIINISQIASSKNAIYILGSNGRVFRWARSDIFSSGSTIRSPITPPTRLIGVSDNGIERGGENDPKQIREIITDPRHSLVLLLSRNDGYLYIVDERRSFQAKLFKNLGMDAMDNPVLEYKDVAAVGDDIIVAITKDGYVYGHRDNNATGSWNINSLTDDFDGPDVEEVRASIQSVQATGSKDPNDDTDTVEYFFTLDDKPYYGLKDEACFEDNGILYGKFMSHSNSLPSDLFGTGTENKIIAKYNGGYTYNCSNSPTLVNANGRELISTHFTNSSSLGTLGLWKESNSGKNRIYKKLNNSIPGTNIFGSDGPPEFCAINGSTLSEIGSILNVAPLNGQNIAFLADNKIHIQAGGGGPSSSGCPSSIEVDNSVYKFSGLKLQDTSP